jgi:hypothetical protein
MCLVTGCAIALYPQSRLYPLSKFEFGIADCKLLFQGESEKLPCDSIIRFCYLISKFSGKPNYKVNKIHFDQDWQLVVSKY